MDSAKVEFGHTLTKIVATASSLALGGGFSVVSLMTIPAFLLAPRATGAAQFAHIYRIGYITQPPLTLVAAMATGLVAYREYQLSSSRWKGWAVSGVLMGAILPWTFGLMEPVSHRILKVVHEQTASSSIDDVQRKGDVARLLRKWNTLNMARGAMATSAGLTAVYLLSST